MVEVSAAIIMQSGEVLLARRAPGEKLAGKWEFPGGKKIEGETIRECLERELLEELEVECVAGEILTESPFELDGKSINLIGIITELKSNNFNLSVHDKIEWVPIKMLLDYEMPPADVPIAEKLVSMYA